MNQQKDVLKALFVEYRRADQWVKADGDRVSFYSAKMKELNGSKMTSEALELQKKITYSQLRDCYKTRSADIQRRDQLARQILEIAFPEELEA